MMRAMTPELCGPLGRSHDWTLGRMSPEFANERLAFHKKDIGKKLQRYHLRMLDGKYGHDCDRWEMIPLDRRTIRIVMILGAEVGRDGLSIRVEEDWKPDALGEYTTDGTRIRLEYMANSTCYYEGEVTIDDIAVAFLKESIQKRNWRNDFYKRILKENGQNYG